MVIIFSATLFENVGETKIEVNFLEPEESVDTLLSFEDVAAKIFEGFDGTIPKYLSNQTIPYPTAS